MFISLGSNIKLEQLINWLMGLFFYCVAASAHAAGGVVGEPGSCMINIGFYTAHFTIYQPESSANEEYCEDLPYAAPTLFVMDYLHDSLREVPVDFRILRDATERGQFTRWEDVAALPDLEAQTVFYREPTVMSGGQFTVEHSFEDAGWYIGVVSAPHPTQDTIYHAVFPFQVAGTFFDFWAIVGLLLMAVPVVAYIRHIRAQSA